MPSIVLFQPQIPQNTGNIIRTCRATNSALILIRPYSFTLSDKRLRRAGLDYYKEMDIQEMDSIEQFISSVNISKCTFFTTKTSKSFHNTQYTEDHYLIFGSEHGGLPESILNKYPMQTATIPMPGDTRCLNLSNCVAVATYEVLRQTTQISN